ncbi:MAG: cyclopropane fatty acyl phospholipid synthase [Candidatus Caldatribacteriota bacterium]|nr:cyclopropane fatty acyl phospholipid synthase [Candidatus Caldatribacteriota bacterium]
MVKGVKQTVQDFLDRADVKIDGKRPWDIQVNNQNLYTRVLRGGPLALGEAYMDGWWDCEALDQFFNRILRLKLKLNFNMKIQVIKWFAWNVIKAKIVNQQRKSKANLIGEQHYDIGNDLYKSMLGKRMEYSCGYWKNAKKLDKAQEAKLDLICRKLNLKPGMSILDIGCGWGSLAKYAAEKYQVKVVGITISKNQVKLARELCKGLNIKILLMDYRNLKEKFDRIVSVGMFEHVGYKNYRKFIKIVDNCLKDTGLFLLHTIGGNKSVVSVNPWIDKYIFPNGMLPSAKQITKAYEGIFRLEDWHSFGIYYDKTLMAWYRNFNKNWDKIKNNYDERFHRMWNYYLLSCAGAFRAHKNQLWQIVFAKIGSQIDYEGIR